MVKPLVLIAACLMLADAHAQNVAHVAQGQLRTMATISPGFSTQGRGTDLYFHGRLEYFLEDRVSFRGQGFLHRGHQGAPSPVHRHHAITFGPSFHLLRDRWDLYAGVEPGVSFARAGEGGDALSDARLRVLPNASLCAGLAFIVWKHFHLFAETRYLQATLTGPPGGPRPLHQMIVSGGLGLHVDTKR